MSRPKWLRAMKAAASAITSPMGLSSVAPAPCSPVLMAMPMGNFVDEGTGYFRAGETFVKGDHVVHGIVVALHVEGLAKHRDRAYLKKAPGQIFHVETGRDNEIRCPFQFLARKAFTFGLRDVEHVDRLEADEPCPASSS